MWKYLAAFAVLASPVYAEEFDIPAIPGNGKFSFDVGLGFSAGPSYPGSDEMEFAPWIPLRNAGFGERGKAELDGFVFLPDFGYVGERDTSDEAALAGLDDIDRAYELGGRVNFGYGPLTSYVTSRLGFGGHDGVTGEVGFRYRTDINDRLSIWSGLEVEYGDSEFVGTYFGVSADEASRSSYGEYDAGSGFTKAAAKFSMRYSLNEITALQGEFEYGRLIGDAGDSPIVQDRDQPVIRLGITRNISLNF
ncbi:MipA/OmpV family protein [Paracoccus sp. Z330]|uniref:MipA/OmpV family protein n=1 Tax=Paracoccus onchidii TaxID=3017813 RepID=A0ABT4ZF93_9RHOB|nr:MipA/OmpV family protein [Paracoccus onchidii]MDB6178045.1 MipA/OmpV family protein [Paracoccus onchidii]